MRGLAASAVVMAHFVGIWSSARWYAYFKMSPLRAIATGHEAVILFFLLSGFVLAIPFSKSGRIDYWRYIVRRVCRIYLPYLAALAVAVTGAWFFYARTKTGNPFIDHVWLRRPDLRAVVQHVGMIGVYNTDRFNGAFWSLVDEMRISIVYPVIWLLAARWSPRLLLPLTIAATFGVAEICQLYGKHINELTTGLYAGMFVVGAVLQTHLDEIAAWMRRLTQQQRFRFFIASLICFEFWCAIPMQDLLKYYVVSYLRDWLVALGGAGLIISALFHPPFQRMLHAPFVKRLGEISYSVYLIHYPIVFVLIRLFYGKFPFVFMLPVYLIAVYLASALLYRTVEVPAIALGRRLTRQRAVHLSPEKPKSLGATSQYQGESGGSS